ncbi:MAG: Mur ligase family protein [Lachnospiraceae bacterium]
MWAATIPSSPKPASTSNSFLSFFPTISIILNIDADHLDFFKDIDDIRHSFRLFAEKLPENGILIINSDIPNYEEITKGLPCRIVTYGSSADSEYSASDITFDDHAHPTFTFVKKSSLWLRFPLGSGHPQRMERHRCPGPRRPSGH